jgi:molecular chaperone Hsp33
VTDRLCRGVLRGRGLRAAFVRVGDTARMCRVLHGLSPTTAHLFAEALAAAALFGSAQDEGGRVNLQLACDGPLRGLLVDADPEGNLRGYVRVPWVHFAGDPAEAARSALGGKGILSVQRDQGGGRFERSTLELEALSLPADLRRWFAASQLVAAAVDVSVVPRGGEPLGEVAGVLVQQLRDLGEAGDEADHAIREARERAEDGTLARALAAGRSGQEIIEAVAGPGFEVQADLEVAYRCGCSTARARMAVSALGPEGIADVLAKEGQATVTCEFCRQRYVLGAAELEELARKLVEQSAGG